MLSYTLRFLAVVLFAIAFAFPGLATNDVDIALILFVTLSALLTAAMLANHIGSE